MINKEHLLKQLQKVDDTAIEFGYDNISVSVQAVSIQLSNLCAIVRELINDHN